MIWFLTSPIVCIFTVKVSYKNVAFPDLNMYYTASDLLLNWVFGPRIRLFNGNQGYLCILFEFKV